MYCYKLKEDLNSYICYGIKQGGFFALSKPTTWDKCKYMLDLQLDSIKNSIDRADSYPKQYVWDSFIILSESTIV